MYDRYFEYFSQKITISDEEKQFIKNFLTVKKLRKRQYLLQEGDVCKTVGFVERGACRLYRLGEDSIEHIVQFALDGAFITDLYSFLADKPSAYNIDAVEDSELVLISRTASDELRKASPKYQEFIFQVTSDAYISLANRITSIMSLSLEERYTELRSNFPGIVERIPQHMIASYMGLTPETLSRVRRRISTK